jgi:ParB-like chromosome segregation protein Spo0J
MTGVIVNVITVKDAEQALRIEIAENENRKEFSFSERMDYAKRLEVIEREKAKERQLSTLNNQNIDMQNIAEREGTTRDIVAESTGFGSGEQYRKAKFISENADEEIIKSLDEGKLSINKAYQTLKQQKPCRFDTDKNY